jgi:hypothetical protein
VVSQYNSDGAPVKATQYSVDGSGNTTSTKALVPTAGGNWADAPRGTPTSPLEKIAGETFRYQTTTLAGTANAGMYTAVEVTNTRTGQVEYIIRNTSTGEAIAAGSSYVVNANNTITTTSAGGSKFTYGLSDGRLLAMQNPDGSGLHRAPDVHAGLQRRLRARRRQRRDQDLSGHRTAQGRLSRSAQARPQQPAGPEGLAVLRPGPRRRPRSLQLSGDCLPWALRAQIRPTRRAR